MDIRDMRTEEAENVVRIIRESILTHHSDEFSKTIIEHMMDLITSEYLLGHQVMGQRVLVATRGDELFGTGRYGRGSGLHGRFYQVFARADVKEKGVEAQLLSCIENLARGTGAHELRGHVIPSTLPFFERLGYRHMHTTNGNFGRVHEVGKFVSSNRYAPRTTQSTENPLWA